MEVRHPEILAAIQAALDEDIGTGDITSELTVPRDRLAHGTFLAKQTLVLAGVELLPLIYQLRGGAKVEIKHKSGAHLVPGDIIARVRGTARTLLECERVALNFLQRLSGVATLARRYVEAVEGTNIKILDTRKTTPGLRRLEKQAAAAGGATNHRFGLWDAVLIKNNHITAAGSVRQALASTKASGRNVEIEVRNRDELDEALSCGAKHLLLDNLSPEQSEEWIRFIDGRATVELSGGINLETVRAYAEAGPDYISCGAITHSANSVDISFRLELETS